MRILINQPRSSYYNGGGEHLPIHQAAAFSELGHEVIFLTSSTEEYTDHYRQIKIDFPNIQFIEANPLPTSVNYKTIPVGTSQARWSIESINFARSTHSIKESLRPDLMCNYYIFDGIFNTGHSYNFLYLLGYTHDADPAYESFFPFYSHIASISKNTARIWQQQYKIDSIPTIYPGIKVGNLGDNPFRHLHGTHVVFAGRLIERKGVRNLVKACKKLLQTRPLYLHILGDGPDIGWLKNYIYRHHLEEYIILYGHRNDIHTYLKYSDLVVLPSLEKEGLMGVVLESLGVGGIVLTSNNNGNEEIIVDGANGYVRDVDTVDKLVVEISSILEQLNLGTDAAIRLKAQQSTNDMNWQANAREIINHITGS